jgi:phospholipid/cholesterol/gamma-HCH transport system ATP-binding protein
MTAASDAMIDLRKVSKAFDERVVLDEVDLAVRRGETLVIIGRSGSGKSVLLKHIIGLIKPDSGEIRVGGVTVNGLAGQEMDALRTKFGMLFQSAALFDSMTTFENVAFPLVEHSKMTPAQIADRVHECLQMVGLQDIDERYPAELSGGMKKRVGLARAIAMHPEIILYDEPTTGIDPIMSAVINELIVTLRNQLKVTSVVVTHDMKSAYTVADRIAMLYNGKILAIGTPDEIRNSPNPHVQQFIKGEAVGPIQEGLPDRRILSRWSARNAPGPVHRP